MALLKEEVAREAARLVGLSRGDHLKVCLSIMINPTQSNPSEGGEEEIGGCGQEDQTV